MAKNLFEVVQALLIPFALLGVVCAGTVHFESRKVRLWFWRSLAAVAVLVLAVAFLREKRLIRYNQINNIRLLAAAIVAGPAYAAAIAAKRSFASALFAAIAGILLSACHLLYAVPVIFSMPFHFVSMGDTYFSTQFLMKCAGYALGWLVCALAALALCKVLSRCKRKAALAVFIPLCLASGFMSFVGIVGIINSYYRRKIRIPAGLRAKLPQLISAEHVVFFAALAVLLALAVAFFIYHTRIHGEHTNPAEHRKLRAFARDNRRWAAFLLALSAFAWADMTLVKKIADTVVELSPSEEFQLSGSDVFIPLEQVSDGHLHRFTWTNAAGKGIRFIIVQKNGMNFGVGFDACDVCGNAGYYERKSDVICNRCDVVMNKNTIGLKGGCNPVPLASRIENGGIVVRTEDLEKEAGRF